MVTSPLLSVPASPQQNIMMSRHMLLVQARVHPCQAQPQINANDPKDPSDVQQLLEPQQGRPCIGVWSGLWGVRKCLSCPIQGTAGIASCMFTKCLPSLRAPGQIVHQLSLVQPMLTVFDSCSIATGFPPA